MRVIFLSKKIAPILLQKWMGGKPRELVFDRDRLIAVAENYGDIIYTKEFETFRQSEKLKIY